MKKKASEREGEDKNRTRKKEKRKWYTYKSEDNKLIFYFCFSKNKIYINARATYAGAEE